MGLLLSIRASLASGILFREASVGESGSTSGLEIECAHLGFKWREALGRQSPYRPADSVSNVSLAYSALHEFAYLCVRLPISFLAVFLKELIDQTWKTSLELSP